MSLFKASLSLLLMLVISTSLAATEFPRGCEVSGFSYENSDLIVNNTGYQSFYLIQNRFNLPVILERHEVKEAFMSPSLKTEIEPLNWSAFASDIENFHFQCFVRENDMNKKVDCREVLEVCQYPRVKFALSNMGNYWVSLNKRQDQVINESANKGILLHW